jgi:hypothetical protein
VSPPGHIERSRQEILQTIGEITDLALVRCPGDMGDELIRAGTRELLKGYAYREVLLDELPGAGGDTALVCGSGGFCHSYHAVMPHVLAVAEMRFKRVIVLPSSFDTSVGVVRDALRHTQAVIFAREQESYDQIQARMTAPSSSITPPSGESERAPCMPFAPMPSRLASARSHLRMTTCH